MLWKHALAILAGWTVIPAFVWALAHEVLRFLRSLNS